MYQCGPELSSQIKMKTNKRRFLLVPGLNVRNVQGITKTLDMGPEDEVIGSKQRLDAIAHLVTNLEKIFILYVGINSRQTLFVVLNESSLGTYWMS